MFAAGIFGIWAALRSRPLVCPRLGELITPVAKPAGDKQTLSVAFHVVDLFLLKEIDHTWAQKTLHRAVPGRGPRAQWPRRFRAAPGSDWIFGAKGRFDRSPYRRAEIPGWPGAPGRIRASRMRAEPIVQNQEKEQRPAAGRGGTPGTVVPS